jgi:hypothetical protein
MHVRWNHGADYIRRDLRNKRKGTPRSVRWAPNPRRIATTIQNHFFMDRIINGERKPFQKTEPISVNDSMDSGVNKKRVDFRKERI